MKITKNYLRDLTYKINGAAIEVHKHLGPGLLESIYHECLKHELTMRGISFISEMHVPVNYKEISLETKLRCDLFVENIIVVDLKAVKEVEPIEEARLLSYMKLLKSPKGIIYNFNVLNLYNEGQKTYVNQFFENLED
ncbi:GxxExxY protein [Aquiflexum balticum DSM 16537]|uniref:GxxExxY protein n=1 Tax=Aquiflexum balticum DSM 16537 TaxID=758820 RepID=A0A1W2H6D5_9BACT|nr:GxxExxY protein [Aquiflexum balticum]SMD44056.1 GxxExxY protein [Aquiflexum balticum DSM 16537]